MEWIEAKTKLPDAAKEYFICDYEHDVRVAHYEPDQQLFIDFDDNSKWVVTEFPFIEWADQNHKNYLGAGTYPMLYWMPIPDIP